MFDPRKFHYIYVLKGRTKVFEFPQVISKTVSSVSTIKKRDQN